MKIVFSLSFILLTSLTIAQSRLGITVSLDYNNNYTKAELSGDNYIGRMLPMLGNTIGINYSSQKRWYYHFEIGLYRTQFSSNLFTAGYSPETNQAFSYLFTRTETKVFVPFNFLFNFNKGPSKLFASIGLMPMFNTKGNAEFIVVIGSNYSADKYDYNMSSAIDRLALGGQFSIGLSQSLSPKIELTLAPVFRTWISSSTNIGSNYMMLPISVGFNVGVYYKFSSRLKEIQ